MSEINRVREDILEVENQIRKLLTDFQLKHGLNVAELEFITNSYAGCRLSNPVVKLKVVL